MIEPFFVSSTDGVDIATYDFGGDGPLLVFCHATGLCGGVWEPIARRLTDRFHCVALDFRAHGRSELPDGVRLRWEGMGQDLLAVIDEMKIRRNEGTDHTVFAVGHSMGGASIVLAELDRPGTITKAWACEPILFPTPEGHVAGEDIVHESPLVAGARRRRSEFDSRQAVIERYSSRPPFDAVDPEALQAYVDYGFADMPDGSVRLRCEPEHEAQVFENSLCGAFERITEITFPFLVAASGDGEAPANIAPTVVAANEQFQLLVYPDLTHFAPLEDPKQLAADIAEWFS